MVLVLVDIEKDIFYSLINLLSIPLKIKPWKGKKYHNRVYPLGLKVAGLV
jgi:hypothetical protein